MHNGCTTALEATVSGKEVFTFNPFDMEYDNKLFNTLGHNLKTKEELLRKVNDTFKKSMFDKNKGKGVNLTNLISNKIYIDESELAAEKILKIWESLNNDKISVPNNWTKYHLFIKTINLKRILLNNLGKLFQVNLGQ